MDRLDKSKLLDTFNINSLNSNNRNRDNYQEKNNFFLKRDGDSNNNYFRNNNNYRENNYNPNYNRNRGYNNGYNNGYNGGRNYNNNYNRNYNNNYNNGGERYYRGGGDGYNNRVFRRNDYERKPDFGVRRSNNDFGQYQDSRRFYREENNFNRNRQNEFDDNNEEYQMEKEALYEKEEFQKNFKKKYSEVIEQIKIVFINEQLKEDEIIQIIKKLNMSPNLTIFEAMNLIYREVQIIKTLQFFNSGQKRKYGPSKDIIETEYDNFINRSDLKNVVQKYKVYNEKNNSLDKNENEDESYLYIDNSDKRRQLLKDENEYFNYLPIYNPNKDINNDNNNDESSDKDIYAKNENEFLYHSLYYKTLMCKYCDLSDENNKENILCPYCHNILKDFRIIYDYKDEGICKFMNFLLESKLFQFEDYANYIDMNFNFNIDTFKIHRCQLDKGCPKDYHLCPYYHSSVKGDEKRRPYALFGYCGSTGDLCFNEKKKKYLPENCVCGIFCHFIHSKNEFNYHPDHYQKKYECTREKVKGKKGKCIYYKTCYGYHLIDNEEEEVEEKEKEEEDENDENKIKEEAENDEKVEEKKKKADLTFMVAKIFRCRKCQYLCKKGELIYFINCKHFVCMKCFKKMISKNNKDNKKEKDKENEKEKEKEKEKLICPFCFEEIKKKEIIKLNY